jgi:hypothetical protein
MSGLGFLPPCSQAGLPLASGLCSAPFLSALRAFPGSVPFPRKKKPRWGRRGFRTGDPPWGEGKMIAGIVRITIWVGGAVAR